MTENRPLVHFDREPSPGALSDREPSPGALSPPVIFLKNFSKKEGFFNRNVVILILPDKK